MNFLLSILVLEIFLGGVLSFECKCNFDDDCIMFTKVEYIRGKKQSHTWNRQEHQASGKYTYMYIPMGRYDNNAAAYLKTTTPLRADGVDRCLSFFYKTTGFPNSRIQVQIWTNELTYYTILYSKPFQRNEGNQWEEAIVDLPGNTAGYLVFAGFQDKYPAQVMLDDVVILEGECFKSRPYPEFPVNVWTSRRYQRTTRPPRFTTRPRAVTTPPLLNDIFFKYSGPYFSNDINDNLWERTLLNLPPGLTLSTAQWIRANLYPPELNIVTNYLYDRERGHFMYLPVGLNYMSPPPYTKAYLMTSHLYVADGMDKCLKLDYIQFQTLGNLGSIGIYLSSYFMTSDVYAFNGHLERLYKYPREGTYVYNSSPYWRSLEVTIPGSRTGHLFIEGVSGTGRGMIAVDNVSVSMGRCPNPNLL